MFETQPVPVSRSVSALRFLSQTPLVARLLLKFKDYTNLKVKGVVKIFLQLKCYKEKMAQFQLRECAFPIFWVRLVPYR